MFIFVRPALLTAALLIAASSSVARRTSIFPVWLRWSGLVVAVLLIPAATVAPVGVALLALWSVAVSAVLFFEAQSGDRLAKSRARR